MKKMFVLIRIAVMVLTIAPQVQAQSQADVQEMQKITADFQAGKISLPEYQKRIEAIQKRPRGDNAGWPSAAWFRQYGHEKLNLKQPAGTTATYDSNDTVIYLTGGNATIVLQGLVSQLEKAHKVKATVHDGMYTIRYAPDRDGDGPAVQISEKDGAVLIYLWHSAG